MLPNAKRSICELVPAGTPVPARHRRPASSEVSDPEGSMHKPLVQLPCCSPLTGGQSVSVLQVSRRQSIGLMVNEREPVIHTSHTE